MPGILLPAGCCCGCIFCAGAAPETVELVFTGIVIDFTLFADPSAVGLTGNPAAQSYRFDAGTSFNQTVCVTAVDTSPICTWLGVISGTLYVYSDVGGTVLIQTITQFVVQLTVTAGVPVNWIVEIYVAGNLGVNTWQTTTNTTAANCTDPFTNPGQNLGYQLTGGTAVGTPDAC